MGIGQVPADWRQQRILVRVEFVPTSFRPSLRFLDVEARETREVLRKELAGILALYGQTELDVATVRAATGA